MRGSLRSLLVLSLAPVVGLSTLLVPSAAQAVGTATISGTVSAQGSQDPLRGIEVALYVQYPSGGFDEVAVTATGSGGKYAFTGVDAGSYRIGFYDTVGEYAPEYYDDAAALASSTPVSVAAGAAVSGRNAQLAFGGKITGTVRGQGGAGLDTGVVEVYSESDDGEGGTYWRAVAYAETGPGGTYEVRGLRTGSYRVRFEDYTGVHLAEYWNDAASVETAHDVVATAGATKANIDAVLQRGGEITGVVTGVGGAPVGDVDVETWRWDSTEADWEYVGYATSEANGSYRVSGLPTGEYRIQFIDYVGRYATEYWDNSTTIWGATSIPVTAGGAATVRNAQLELGGVISGTVTASSSTEDVVAVAYQLVHGHWRSVGGGYVRSDGAYVIDSLPAGTYRLRFYDYNGVLADEYWDDKPIIDLAADITVTAGTTAGGYNAVLGTTPPPAVPPAAAPVPPAPPAPLPPAPPVVDTAHELSELLADVRVKGKPVVGRTLSLKNLAASFRGTVRYRVKWYAGKKAIKKATKPKLELTRALQGKVISVRVKATSGGVTETRKIKVGKVKP